MHLDAKNKVEWSFKRKKKRKKAMKKIHDNVPWFKKKEKTKKEKEKRKKRKKEKMKQTIPDDDLPSPDYQKQL